MFDAGASPSPIRGVDVRGGLSAMLARARGSPSKVGTAEGGG